MTKSVFIIGAGASLDFGLPSGEQLVGDISSLFAEFQKVWKKNQPTVAITTAIEERKSQRHCFGTGSGFGRYRT